MKKKEHGYGLIEAMMVTALSTVILLGGVESYKMFSESNELDDRSVITAQQIAQFSEASYLYASQNDNMSDDIITVTELNDNGFLVDTFPLKTPYGQEIKGFLVENEDSPSLNDILVATTGEPDEAMINKTGQNKESYNKNQMKTYYSIRRELLSIDNSYNMGIIDGDQFATENDLVVRDISKFGATIDTKYKQVGVYMISPEARSTDSDVVVEIRAIGAYPNEDVPANGIEESIVSISIRDSNGNPVDNSEIEWSTTSSATLSATKSYTDSEGLATVKVTSTVEETAKIVGRSVDANDIKSVDINFMGYDIASLVADEYNNVKAFYIDNNDVSCNYVTGTLQYPDGTPARDVRVKWESTNGQKLYMGTRFLTSKTSKTDDNGVAQICIKSQDGGDYEIEMEAPNGEIDSVNINFADFRVISYSLPDGVPKTKERLNIDVVVGYPDGETVGSNIRARTFLYSDSYNGIQSSATTNSFGEASISYPPYIMKDKKYTIELLTDGGDLRNPPTFDFEVEMPRILSFYASEDTSDLKVNDFVTLTAVVGFADGTPSSLGTVNFNSPKGGILRGASLVTNDDAPIHPSTYESEARFFAEKEGDYRVTASLNDSSMYIDLHVTSDAETRYDAKNYVLGESHSCQAITPPITYSIYWDGIRKWSGTHDYKKSGSFNISGSIYSWSATPIEKDESLDPMGAPCASKMGNTYWKYSVTKSKP